MWIILFFDLPTLTTTHRKRYTKFKQVLKKQHFHQLQYSVYARHTSPKSSASITTKMCQLFPKEGDMRIIRIADPQYYHSIHIHDNQPIAAHLPTIPVMVW